MPNTFTDADQTLLFLLTAICLGACFIWAFWEIEQMRERRRQTTRAGAVRRQSDTGRVF
jgi:hypothetical protein